MSGPIPFSPDLVRFWRSKPTPCPYLPERQERKVFTVLHGPRAAGVNATLTQAGFRRSHDIVYRPSCVGCAACVPVRVDAAALAERPWIRRVQRRNRDLAAAAAPARATAEQFALFVRYQKTRHADSDMAAMGWDDYQAMVEVGAADSFMLELRDPAGALAGAMLVDDVGDGLSAVYSFFAPEREKRSPGSHLVAMAADAARRRGLSFLYLGYWIAGSRKMAYKARFQPLEAYIGERWTRFAPPASGDEALRAAPDAV